VVLIAFQLGLLDACRGFWKAVVDIGQDALHRIVLEKDSVHGLGGLFGNVGLGVVTEYLS
jgi:hypothetical protein